ncbi:hypothetical protein SISNIDRAFT_483143 [Sistotremastrum niveocremeum HHB9708]|uniref:Uncharacterized protein n=1 Tax=Sistotremastrum niveocremeum HHB9708 TaxID=1314777 RepID=A0A164Y550_9AGAM|nr:hypothetical protein SISNIDRAFT_483143 [Sistotremastrum niveocremeum HHB9708]
MSVDEPIIVSTETHCVEFSQYRASLIATHHKRPPSPDTCRLISHRQLVVENHGFNLLLPNSIVREWIWQSSDNRWEAVEVSEACQQDRFDSYQMSQRYYNARENEWHLCSSFTQPVALRDSVLPIVKVHNQIPLPPTHAIDRPTAVAAAAAASAVTSHGGDVPQTSSFEAKDTFVPWLIQYYGYVPRSCRPASTYRSGSVSVQQWMNLRNVFGFFPFEADADAVPLDAPDICEFYESLMANTRDSDDLFDLLASQHEGRLERTRRSAGLARVQRPANPASHDPRQLFYKLSWEHQTHRPWNLLFTKATQAVHIYRQQYPNIIVATWYCLEHGIAFSTMATKRDLGSPDPTESPPYWCLAGYQEPILHLPSRDDFTQAQYAAYERLCKIVLSRPSGRAALCAGGIIGRIARDYLPFELALDGPSRDATHFGRRWGFEVHTGSYQGLIFDDILTSDVSNVLSGRYVIPTPRGQNKDLLLPDSVYYYWPPDFIWAAAANKQNLGYWTPRNEHWFRRLQGQYRAGLARPKKAQEWRTFLRWDQNKATQLKNNYENLANEFTRRFL